MRDGFVRREHRGHRIGIVGVDVHPERRLVAHDQERVAERLERRREPPLLEVGSGDGEAGAVAVGRRRVLRMGHAGTRAVFAQRRVPAREPADDARDEHGQGVAAGVDDARLAKHWQQLGSALHGVLARLERAHDHARDRRVLLLGTRVRGKPGIGHSRGLGGDLRTHLADHGRGSCPRRARGRNRMPGRTRGPARR